jgi:hypothetical protein
MAFVKKLRITYAFAPGTTFAPDGTPQGYITRITAESIHGIEPWSE